MGSKNLSGQRIPPRPCCPINSIMEKKLSFLDPRLMMPILWNGRKCHRGRQINIRCVRFLALTCMCVPNPNNYCLPVPTYLFGSGFICYSTDESRGKRIRLLDIYYPLPVLLAIMISYFGRGKFGNIHGCC